MLGALMGIVLRSTAIRVEVLPARLGDCILVECPRGDGRPWRMLVDGGPPDTWDLLQARLRELPDPVIDVAMVSHIDSDHIGGFLPFLQSPLADAVADFWFNGREHLPDKAATKRSVAQGNSLMAELSASARPRPWNLAFDGGPIETHPEHGFRVLRVPEGPTITVLSPTIKRLTILGAKWHETVERAKRGRAAAAAPDAPLPLVDLRKLADEKTGRDASPANGSSIALLVEYRGASVILGADAFGNVLGAALCQLARSRGTETLPVDAFKLPHHGSQNNITTALIGIAPARHYLVSTNGDTFRHPDDTAIARTVLAGPPGATLWFNYRNRRTKRWAEGGLRKRHDYSVRFPDDDVAGSVLELPERP
jgi:beta-lactamase superfamily II metal-dependent hydrolase